MASGRTKKYRDAAAMMAVVEKYIAGKLAKDEFPSEPGMKLELGLSDRTIRFYCSETENPDHWQEYRDVFEYAQLVREDYLVSHMVKDNKVAQGCMNALKQPANGGYIDRPVDSGKIELTVKVLGIGGMEKFD